MRYKANIKGRVNIALTLPYFFYRKKGGAVW